jgi:type IV secretory pathway TrbL component
MSIFYAFLIALFFVVLVVGTAIIYARSAAQEEDDIDFTLDDWRGPFL